MGIIILREIVEPPSLHQHNYNSIEEGEAVVSSFLVNSSINKKVFLKCKPSAQLPCAVLNAHVHGAGPRSSLCTRLYKVLQCDIIGPASIFTSDASIRHKQVECRLVRPRSFAF